MNTCVLVCGSRDWAKPGMIDTFLTGLRHQARTLTVIEGGARGADTIAGNWARRNANFPLTYKAKWNEHDADWCPGDWCGQRGYCVGAGPRRNQLMLDVLLEHQDDQRIVVAFKSRFDFTLAKGGTEDMVRRAKAAGVACYVVSGV